MALPDGTLAPWSGIQLKLKKMHGILQFQGIQESGERLIIQVVPLRESRSLRSAILAAARSAVGGKLGVQVEFVNSIPRSKSGKTADFVSKVRAGP